MTEHEQRLIAEYHRLNADYKAARKHGLSDYFLAVTLACLNTVVRILGYTPAASVDEYAYQDEWRNDGREIGDNQ